MEINNEIIENINCQTSGIKGNPYQMMTFEFFKIPNLFMNRKSMTPTLTNLSDFPSKVKLSIRNGTRW